MFAGVEIHREDDENDHEFKLTENIGCYTDLWRRPLLEVRYDVLSLVCSSAGYPPRLYIILHFNKFGHVRPTFLFAHRSILL
jgi:hypothetical protein